MQKWLSVCLVLAACGCDGETSPPAEPKATQKDGDKALHRPGAETGQDRAGKEVPGSAEEALSRGKPMRYWLRQLTDKNPDYRVKAAHALGDFGVEGKAAVPHLINALEDKDSGARIAALQALGEIGPEAETAIPSLESQLSGAEESETIAILAVLTKIDTRHPARGLFLVAKQSQPRGTLISDPRTYFTLKILTIESTPRGALSKLNQVRGKRLVKPLVEGACVTGEDLFECEETTPMKVAPGYRAVSIKILPTDSGSGFILPGSHVDVICLSRTKEGGATARTVVQNVAVLTIDAGPGVPDPKRPNAQQIVTLQVAPQQAVQLAEAQVIGEIRLSLRGIDDRDIEPSSRSERKSGELAPTVPEIKPPASAPPPR